MNDLGESAVEVEGYRLVPVYGRVDSVLRPRIERMWVDEGALTRDVAARRVNEVVIAILSPAGEVAGVNTVYVQRPPGGSDAWYYYRTFVRAAHRGSPKVACAAVFAAIDVLRDHPHPLRPSGILAVIENPRLENRGPMRQLERLGLSLIGRDRRGRHVWGTRFDGATPTLPPGLVDPH